MHDGGGPTHDGVEIGADIQAVDDVEWSLQHFGQRYVERFFDQDEALHVRRHPRTAARYLAERFAAREAVLKLLKIDDALRHWHDVAIVPRGRSSWEARLADGCRDRADQWGITRIHVGVTSVMDAATAVAVADTRRGERERLS